MQINHDRVRGYLKRFDFETLFIEELGWDYHEQPLQLSIDGKAYTLSAIAQKRNMVVYGCGSDSEGKIPKYATRRKIDQEVTKYTREHLIIYTDTAQTEQRWQWVRREIGKPTACREQPFYKNQSGDALIQKLEVLAVSLEEEEELTSAEVQDRTRRAFDLDRVTKKFYEQFKKEHAAFLNFIQGIPAASDREWYASVMLNRLMFIYFIQKKRFLNNDRDYLQNKLKECQEQRGQDEFYSFYRYFLLKLFHDGLGKQERTPELEKLLGRVPYLNGGLFEVHQLEQANPEIQIPDAAFEKIFKFLGEWDWQLDDRPLKKGNEINPDVLGYIFEKYINQKQMGAYYTKEDITEYISKNCIIPFLVEAAKIACAIAFKPDSAVWQLLRDNPERYIHEAVRKGVDIPLPGEIAAGVSDVSRRKGWNRPADADFALPTETWREQIARRQRCLELRRKLAAGEIHSINDLITYNLNIRQFAQDIIENCEGPELLRAIYQTLEKVTILDPTCGSGAFLFAALSILEPLYEACLERMQVFLDELARSSQKSRPEKFSDFRQVLERVAEHRNRRYFILKSIILNNLYGVDIMEEATEICKLRLFLKLVSQVDPDNAKPNYGLEPLPDIDFNIRSGNTLVGFANYEEVHKAILGDGQGKLDFGNDMQRIDESAEIADRAFQKFREMQTEHGMDAAQFTEAKANLRRRLDALNQELNRYLAGEYGVDVKKPAAFEQWRQSHQPFHWFVEFYSILKRGGFDVIIGNPPYVEYRLVKSSYKLQQGCYQSETADNLYAFCMERSGALLRRYGCFGMIIPAGVLGLDDAASLREVLLKRFTHNFCSTYAIRPSKLFDGVDQRLCIYIGKVNKESSYTIWTTRYHHWNSDERTALFPCLTYCGAFQYERLKRIPQIGSHEAASILAKLESKSKRLVSSYFSSDRYGYIMHYHRSPRYWIRSMDFEQYFKSQARNRSVHHFRNLYFNNISEGKIVGAILNSSLFFFWFLSVGNGRNITVSDVESFPVGELNKKNLKELPDIFAQLMSDYKANSLIKVRQDCEFQEFRPSQSKSIIDKIDRVLAQHYDFTDEELDFIINYDIKYRMGRDNQDDQE